MPQTCLFFPIFARMKKWLIIYAFFLGLLGLAYTGHACPTEKKTTFSTPGIKLKRGFVVGIEENNHKQGDNSIVLSLRTRTPLPITAFPAMKENGPAVTYYHTGGVRPVIAEKEGLMYDHLLHLFPSHYFW